MRTRQSKMKKINIAKIEGIAATEKKTLQEISREIGANPGYLGDVIREAKKNGEQYAYISEKYRDNFCNKFNIDPDDLSKRKRTSKVTPPEYQQITLADLVDSIEEDNIDDSTAIDPKNILLETELKLIESSTLLLNLATLNMGIYKDLKHLQED